MKMLVAHSGRTGKDSSITFDTERKAFCYGRAKHDVFIYAERKADVTSVVGDLTKLGYKEISVREFENGRENVTTRSQMQELKAGDESFVNGQRHMEKGKIFVVTETGWDSEAVPFMNVQAFQSHQEAKELFREKLMHEVLFDEDAWPSSDFDKKYRKVLDAEEYDDAGKYLLKIVSAEV